MARLLARLMLVLLMVQAVPAAARQQATAAGQLPATARQAPTATSQPPAATSQLSAATGQVPAHIGAELEKARLAGEGSYTYFGLDIYSAQLWVGGAGLRGDVPGAQPFALELAYARSLSGERIAAASVDQMASVGVGSEAERQAWLRQMTAIFPDVKKGTRLCGVYSPQQGVRFYLDGKLLANVPDAAFARAFFSIWLHPNTTAKPLRRALLRDAGLP